MVRPWEGEGRRGIEDFNQDLSSGYTSILSNPGQRNPQIFSGFTTLQRCSIRLMALSRALRSACLYPKKKGLPSMYQSQL